MDGLQHIKFHVRESVFFYIPSFNEKLDCIIISKGDEINIENGSMCSPFERQKFGCDQSNVPKALNKENTVVSYRDVKTKKTCCAEISADYGKIKTASDHRPLCVDLEIN